MPSTQNMLPSPPSPDTLTLLIRSKLLLEHAVGHASAPSGIDPIVAIHGFDNSIEYLVRIVAAHLDFEGNAGKPFPQSSLSEMHGALNKYLQGTYKKALPYIEDVKTLRQVRNLAQHAAIDITKDLAQFERITVRFHQRTVELVFGLQLEELAVSSLINDSTVKSFLAEAETELADKRYLEAVEAARDAFENAYLNHRSRSNVRLLAAPALAKAKPTRPEDAAFFGAIANELQALKLNIDSTKLARFQHIVDHVPYDRRIDKRGNIVLQRPWEENDAKFCIGFASEYALKWQLQAIDPLYLLPADRDEYSSTDYINSNPIKHEARLGCHFGGLGQTGQLMYVDSDTLEMLRPHKTGEIVRWAFDNLKNGKLTTRIEYSCRIICLSDQPATNRPPRWEVYLATEQLPFTWERVDYQDGVPIKKSLSINSSDAAAFTDLYGITEDLAAKLVSLRNALGRIERTEQLKTISGITDQQIEWLVNFTGP